MYEKCIECKRIGESCVPNLWLLPFHDLIQWCNKRQKHLGWTNHVLEEKSGVPVSTIQRIKGGDTDCRYSTIRNMAIALIGGTKDEFPCTDIVAKELEQVEMLERQAARLSVVEAENEVIKGKLEKIDEQHRSDIRIVKEEYTKREAQLCEQIGYLLDDNTFLKEMIRAQQSR